MTSYAPLVTEQRGKKVKTPKDPYPKIKKDLENEISQFSFDYDEWYKLLHNTNTANNFEFYHLTNKLKSTYKMINSILNQISDYITNDKAKNILTTDEINNRLYWIKNMRNIIKNIKNNILSNDNQIIINKHRNSISTDTKDSNYAVEIKPNTYEPVPYDSSPTETTTSISSISSPHPTTKSKVSSISSIAIDYNTKLLQLERKEQDTKLDDILTIVSRLRTQGEDIKIELQDQNEIIEESNIEVDNLNDNIKYYTQKLNKIIANSTTSKSVCMIIVLIIILIVLLYFIVNTAT